MNDYYYLSRNSSPDGDVIDFQSNSDDSSAFVSEPRDGNFTVSSSADVRLQQSRRIDQNNHRLLTWNISLTDDQDEVSKHFLRMYYEPILVTEKFVPDILMVPENIRKQADKLFKPSEINSSDIFDLVNIKVSWILPSNYQQYLKSIPKNEKTDRHVLYPWTQWNDTGARPASHRSPNSVGASPTASSDDRSSLSLSLSSSSWSQHALAMNGRSPHSSYNNDSNTSNNNNDDGNNNSTNNSNNNSNNDNNISSSSSSSGGSNYKNWPFGVHGEADSTSPASHPSRSIGTATVESLGPLHRTTWSQPQQQRRRPPQQQQAQSDAWAAVSASRSPSDRGRSVSSADLYDDCDDRPSPSPPFAQDTAVSPAARRWPSRLFYCVNTDSNTINKLVEHYCTFCYKNQEPPEVYGSHLVRDAVRTTCPRLRALRCKHCNGTGDSAHTIKYCPFVYANYS